MDPRREHVRRLLQVDAYITNVPAGKPSPVQIIDISRMGVAFVSDQPMDVDAQFLLQFCFPGSAVSNRIMLTVVNSIPVGSQGRYRSGARFLAIADDCADRIVDYVTTAPA